MIYNILIKILQYIHSNYERYMMNKLSTNFQQTFNTSCITNFQQIFRRSFATNWVTDISSYYTSSQIEWQNFHNILQHIIHHIFITNWVTKLSQHSSTHHSSYLHHKLSDKTFTTFFNIVHSTIEYGSFISAYHEF